MMRILSVGLFAAASVLFGQLDSNSITVTASRSVYLPADQVIFLVAVSSPLDTTLDNIVAALQGSGITAANLSGSFGSLAVLGGGQTQWIFTLPAPFAKMKSTVTLLTALQQTISQKNNALNLTFSVRGTQVSAPAQDSQCAPADLISDARTQAQKLADAAGATLGPILALDRGSSGGDSMASIVFAVPTLVQRIGDFSYAGFLLGSPVTGVLSTSTPTSPALTCSITVKFALLRYQ